jgi:hypothetical protein
MLAVAQDGAVYATRLSPDDVLMLRETDDDAKGDEHRIEVKMRQLRGVAMHDRLMNLATAKSVYAADTHEESPVGNLQTIIGDSSNNKQHAIRTLALGLMAYRMIIQTVPAKPSLRRMLVMPSSFARMLIAAEKSFSPQVIVILLPLDRIRKTGKHGYVTASTFGQ